MKRLILTLSITCLSVLFASTFAFAGFERSLHNIFDTQSPAQGNIEGGLAFDYSRYSDDAGSAKVFVADPYVKYGIMNQWEVGLDVPYLDIKPKGGDSESGVGDMNVWTKYRFLDESKDKIGLAGGVSAKLATGDQDDGLGTGKVDWTPFAMASYKADKIVFGGKLGYTFVGKPDDSDWKDTFNYGVWARYEVDERLGVVGELFGNTKRVSDSDSDAPLEFDAGVTYGIAENVGVVAGVGAGLSNASPDWRAFAAIKGCFNVMAK